MLRDPSNPILTWQLLGDSWDGTSPGPRGYTISSSSFLYKAHPLSLSIMRINPLNTRSTNYHLVSVDHNAFHVDRQPLRHGMLNNSTFFHWRQTGYDHTTNEKIGQLNCRVPGVLYKNTQDVSRLLHILNGESLCGIENLIQ